MATVNPTKAELIARIGSLQAEADTEALKAYERRQAQEEAERIAGNAQRESRRATEAIKKIKQQCEALMAVLAPDWPLEECYEWADGQCVSTEADKETPALVLIIRLIYKTAGEGV